MLLVLTFLIGVIAGLRAMTAPAAVSWAAFPGALNLSGTPFAWLGYGIATTILTLLALGELVADQLPSAPSRKVPVQFGTRIVAGALTGAAIAAAAGNGRAGAAAGAIGAVVGTYGGAAVRSRLAENFGHDRPAALIEDGVAIGGAVLVLYLVAQVVAPALR